MYGCLVDTFTPRTSEIWPVRVSFNLPLAESQILMHLNRFKNSRTSEFIFLPIVRSSNEPLVSGFEIDATNPSNMPRNDSIKLPGRAPFWFWHHWSFALSDLHLFFLLFFVGFYFLVDYHKLTIKKMSKTQVKCFVSPQK